MTQGVNSCVYAIHHTECAHHQPQVAFGLLPCCLVRADRCGTSRRRPLRMLILCRVVWRAPIEAGVEGVANRGVEDAVNRGVEDVVNRGVEDVAPYEC